MNNVDLIEWRSRLQITQEKAASLLGVHRVTYTNWENNTEPVCRSTKLALLACELAYIAADQYVKKYPSTLNNIGSKNLVETLGKKKIIDDFLNYQNDLPNDLLISLRCQSLINRIKQS